MSTDLSREVLIDLCSRGIVPVDEWCNRDSADAQRQLGEALALLRAGCDARPSADPMSDERTIWIRISYPGFNAFEHGRSERAAWEDDLFYIPTHERLMTAQGRDWY